MAEIYGMSEKQAQKYWQKTTLDRRKRKRKPKTPLAQKAQYMKDRDAMAYAVKRLRELGHIK